MKLPIARTGNLLEQNLRIEILIYDLSIDEEFDLNLTKKQTGLSAGIRRRIYIEISKRNIGTPKKYIEAS